MIDYIPKIGYKNYWVIDTEIILKFKAESLKHDFKIFRYPDILAFRKNKENPLIYDTILISLYDSIKPESNIIKLKCIKNRENISNAGFVIQYKRDEQTIRGCIVD